MGRRSILLLLLWSIISYAMSPRLSAQTASFKPEILAANQEKSNKPQIIKEVIEKRGSNYKNYLLSDGSYQLEIHESIIHYKDEHGNYQNINTNLVDEMNISESVVPISKEAATKRKNINSMKLNKEVSSLTSFQVPFYSKISKKIAKGYSIETEGASLSFIPLGASKSSVGIVDTINKSKIKYQEVWPNTDVELQVVNDGIKENIILKNDSSPRSISFEVTGDIATDNLFIHSPWIKDANGNTRSVKIIEHTEGSKKYIDYTWDGKNLAYPAVIDPIVSLQSSNVGCVNQYYATYGCSTSNLQIAYKHQIGTDKIYGNTYRSFIQFRLPSILNASITNATLNMSQIPSNSFQGSGGPTITVKPYALAGEWPTNWNGATWSGPALYESENMSSTFNVELFNTGPSRTVQFDVTGIFNHYYFNKSSSSVALALVATNLTIPPTIPDKEYFLQFSDPTLSLTYTGIIYSDLSPPTKPSELIVTSVTNNSVSLSWLASVDNTNPVFYEIIRNGSVTSTWYTNSYTATGLTENTSYTFTVRAFDQSSNKSMESNTITVTTGSGKPIANFLNLSAFGDYSNPFTIKWSYYDPSGQKLTAYEIKGSNDNWATIGFDTGIIAATAPVDFSTNLISSKKWSFAIRASNASGMGDWSYINNITINESIVYFYDSSGRIDYLILDDRFKIKYKYDKNGNLIQTFKTPL